MKIFAEFTNARKGALFDYSIENNVFPAAQYRITKKKDLESQAINEYKVIPFEEMNFEQYRAATDEEINYYCRIRGITTDDLFSVLPPDAHLEEELENQGDKSDLFCQKRIFAKSINLLT